MGRVSVQPARSTFSLTTAVRIIPGNYSGTHNKSQRNQFYKLGADFDTDKKHWYFAAGLANVQAKWDKIKGLSTPKKKQNKRSATARPSPPPRPSFPPKANPPGPSPAHHTFVRLCRHTSCPR